MKGSQGDGNHLAAKGEASEHSPLRSHLDLRHSSHQNLENFLLGKTHSQMQVLDSEGSRLKLSALGCLSLALKLCLH